MKIGLISLGCFKNQVDAEKILFKLKQSGFEICTNLSLCEIIIINTCGFIESAKQEAINTILEICELKKSYSSLKKVIVTGCLAQRYKTEILKNIPEVDVVLGIGANENIVALIKESLQTDKKIENFPTINKFSMEGDRIIDSSAPFAYVKIADGCNNRCSYCAIPLIRGPFKSRKKEDILNEIHHLAENGVREVNLIAQDTTNYGSDIYGEFKLPELIEDISKIDKIKWIRILYCYPDHITEELLQEIKNNPKVVKYFDIPLQHVDGEILKQMNRTGNMKSIAALLHKIRSIIPEAVIRTTFILGFPGESGAQFETLCQFVEDHKFERLGYFTYSQEENTKAAQLPDQIDYEIKTAREQTLMDIQSIIIDKFSASLVGKTFEVLIEKVTKDGNFVGRTYMDAPDVDGMVYFNENSNCKIGDFVKVQIDDYEGYELFGHLIK